jgi:predicted acylesterase/phospholipase RssA
VPYIIELLSLGSDVYPQLESAASRLNTAQSTFLFKTAGSVWPTRAEGLNFRRDVYKSSEVFNFIEDQRNKHGGNHPHIIAFVNRPLESDVLTNIFGTHRASAGLAVATLWDSGQYVREESRFCSYFIARYALSFVNPTIKSHNDPNRRSCYFNKKMQKQEIRLSMDSGDVCDDCSRQLAAPTATSGAKPASAEELDALRLMRQAVSGDIPHAIVMKGGGVKGLAFAGALVELEKYYWFDRHVGASAGAITAILLAAGYLPENLITILRRKNFRDFKDAGWWWIPFNLLTKLGMFPGEDFRVWMAELVGAKSGKLSETKMSDLNGALVYACRRGPGTLEFDSTGSRSETGAAFAARCSMSIPLFFFPQMVEGRRVYDGGLLNNFPLQTFIASFPMKPFVALYLGKPDNVNRSWFLRDLLDIWIDAEERTTVDRYAKSVVSIDTTPIGTVDFDLSALDKEFLIEVGRASALKFLFERKFDDGPEELVVQQAQRRADELRAQVVRRRRGRSRARILIGVAVLLASLAAWLVL